MIFQHINGNSVLNIDRRSYDHNLRNDKPGGFWLSVKGSEPDWREWCAGEQFYTFNEPIGYVHEMDVDVTQLLVLNSYERLEKFHNEFAGRGTGLYGRNSVRWNEVANLCKGIVIAPYQWQARLSHIGWYYGWDCGSACIWDTSVISNVRCVDSFVKNVEERSLAFNF